MSNVIPFPGRTVSPWFYIANEMVQEELLTFPKGHPVCSIFSEEDFLRRFAQLKPAFVLIRDNLTWTDPLALITRLNELSNSPILLLLKKRKSKNQENFIRQAFQAGVFDILHLPLQEIEVEETVNLILRVSKKVTSG
ncbi:MAG: hypothetical protein ACKN9V_08080 [Pseudomonadota bacterium]